MGLVRSEAFYTQQPEYRDYKPENKIKKTIVYTVT